MSGVASVTAPAADAPDDDPSPAAALFPTFSQHLQAVERAGGGMAGGSMAVAARRAALSSLWEWLRQAGSDAEADGLAAERLHQLYRSVTADQVSLLCAIIQKASVDGMENGVSQRADSEPARSEGRGGWLRCCAVRGGSNELIRFHHILHSADVVIRHSPVPASAALW